MFDHVLGRCVLGYKLLALAFFDGRSTVACDFSLYREKGRDGGFGLSEKERKTQRHTRRAAKSPAAERHAELDTRKISFFASANNASALRMIERAWKRGLHARYALMDTWFVNGAMVSALRSLCGGAVHLVGRMRMGGDRFEHAGRRYNAAQMVARYSREATVCKKYRCTHLRRAT